MTVSLNQFIRNLTASGLVTAEELKAFRRNLPPDQQPQDVPGLAKALVQAGKLTRYQAVCVYQRRIRGLVLDDYVVLDRIGAGSMGQVFKARHRRMKREVALKVLPPKALKSRDVLRRFYREVEAIARLSHPNIVTAYDASEHHGIHYLVMEYVEGQDLSSLVKSHGPLSIRLALECVLQAARGLEYAHKQGVVHRDIKPGNLLLDRSGTVKILDLGLALVQVESNPSGVDRLTGSSDVMGTCDYMAPEQAEQTHQADHRADIYSLGCTLYCLLIGEPPYRGKTLMKVLLAHRTAAIPSLSAARPEVPAVLDAVFRRMLAKRPEDRQQSMSEVIAELEACLQSEQPAGEMLPADGMDVALKDFLESLPAASVTAPKRTLEETLVSQADESTSPGATPSVTSILQKQVPVSVLLGVAALMAVVAGLLLVTFGGGTEGVLPGGADGSTNSPGTPGTPGMTAVRNRHVPSGHVTVLWREAERAGATLEVDGAPQDLIRLANPSAKDQLRLALAAGEHRIRIVRPGFEPFDRRFVLQAGDELILEPRWRAAAAGENTEEGPPEAPRGPR